MSCQWSCHHSRPPWHKVNGVGEGPREETSGARACCEGSMPHLTPTCPFLERAGLLTTLTHSLPRRWVSPAVTNERLQSCITTCVDLLTYCKKRWQNEESLLFIFRSPLKKFIQFIPVILILLSCGQIGHFCTPAMDWWLVKGAFLPFTQWLLG